MTTTSNPVAPAPWNLTGLGYVFLLRTPFVATGVPLPSGSYGPLESGTSADQSASFCGGIGMVMLVRYETSDIGPYDELLYVPGLFKTPPKDKGAATKSEYHLSITRIYVSTTASVENGRRNWGINKHLANFSFEDTDKTTTLVTVSDPSTSATIFKSSILKTRWTPSFPLNTNWLKSTLPTLSGYQLFLRQPPLPSGEQTKEVDASSLIGSTSTFIVRMAASGWGKLAYLERSSAGAEAEPFGDGIRFPAIEPALRGAGVRMQFKMVFEVPEVVVA